MVLSVPSVFLALYAFASRPYDFVSNQENPFGAVSPLFTPTWTATTPSALPVSESKHHHSGSTPHFGSGHARHRRSTPVFETTDGRAYDLGYMGDTVPPTGSGGTCGEPFILFSSGRPFHGTAANLHS